MDAQKNYRFFWILFLHWFLTSMAAGATDLETKVQEILQNATTQNHQRYVKELAKLGKPAVPILIAKLSQTGSAVLIVNALQRIGDPASVPPLIAFLDQLNLDEQKQIILSRAVFSALKELEDARAEPRLLEILQDERILVANRLYAATALARLGSAQSQQQVRSFVLNTPTLNQEVVSPIDLDTAYFEIGTKEALEKLEHAFNTGHAYEQLFIVDLFAARPNPQMSEMIFRAAENPNAFPQLRERAIEALVEQRVSKERLLKILYSLRNDVPDTSNNLVNKKKVDHLIERVQKNRQ